MEFFNRIHCKYTGIKGFLTVYNDAIKYRYMITEKAEYKVKVLVFWEKARPCGYTRRFPP